MITRHNQRDVSDNVLQFRRDLKQAPLRARCNIPMVVMGGEPEVKEPRALRVTYRCAECGLIEQFKQTGRE
jgi:hypothetical protein